MLRGTVVCGTGYCGTDLTEVIAPDLGLGPGTAMAGLRVVESPPTRAPRERRTLGDDGDLSLSDMHETASWTY